MTKSVGDSSTSEESSASHRCSVVNIPNTGNDFNDEEFTNQTYFAEERIKVDDLGEV